MIAISTIRIKRIFITIIRNSNNENKTSTSKEKEKEKKKNSKNCKLIIDVKVSPSLGGGGKLNVVVRWWSRRRACVIDNGIEGVRSRGE